MNTAYPYHVGDGRLADLETSLLRRVEIALRESQNHQLEYGGLAAHAAIVRDICAAMASIRSMRALTPDAAGTEKTP